MENNDNFWQTVRAAEPVIWQNPHLGQVFPSSFTSTDIEDAANRLERFAPWIMEVCPQTVTNGGLIESPLEPIPAMRAALGNIRGNLLLKRDDILPLSGSVKARGGFYEVLKHAESLALAADLLKPNMDYRCFSAPAFRELFAAHSIAVGSTGNLGLSIGIISALLGFRVSVYMSHDARQWKKDLLRSKGVRVIDAENDYEAAVAEGRRVAAADPSCHFVDDEKSADLFLGYAVAALRLKQQLDALNIPVDSTHPLCVYIPCGVGGAPGGITFGLKQLYGTAANCFFAEPVQAPCILVGMASEKGNAVSALDLGLNGHTDADGLAVTRPSPLVWREMRGLLDGCYTLRDNDLFDYLRMLYRCEAIRIEPSACAGFAGPSRCGQDNPNVTHIVWSTGGGMVPEAEMRKYLYD